MSLDIQPPFGGQFRATLGDQATGLGRELHSKRQHLGGHRHLQIKPRLHQRAQQPHVPLLDMAPILAQMHGDAVRASLLRQQGGLYRIGIARVARLPQGCHMVDVYPQGGEESQRMHGETSNLGFTG